MTWSARAQAEALKPLLISPWGVSNSGNQSDGLSKVLLWSKTYISSLKMKEFIWDNDLELRQEIEDEGKLNVFYWIQNLACHDSWKLNCLLDLDSKALNALNLLRDSFNLWNDIIDDDIEARVTGCISHLFLLFERQPHFLHNPSIEVVV
jgi:hypothetical protein